MLTTRSEFYQQLTYARSSIRTVLETFGGPRTLGDHVFINAMETALDKINDMISELVELEEAEAENVTD
jgi:hypothetical protein